MPQKWFATCLCFLLIIVIPTIIIAHTEADPFVTHLIADWGNSETSINWDKFTYHSLTPEIAALVSNLNLLLVGGFPPACTKLDLGKVNVWNLSSSLDVIFERDGDWSLTKTHSQVANTLKKNGNPVRVNFDEPQFRSNQMNSGKCRVHDYRNIDQPKIDFMLKSLRESGATVKGNNPWHVETNKHGVKLQAGWEQTQSLLKVMVTAKNFYVPYSKIWDEIDPLINHLQ
jgi:hypothetical protein